MAQTLDEAAGEVNRWLKQEGKLRVMAALGLRDLRKRIDAGEAGPIGWEEWCKKNIERGYRDVQKLLALANDPNPDKALERERAQNRAASRKRAASKGRHDMASLQKAILKLPKSEQLLLLHWLERLLATKRGAAHAA